MRGILSDADIEGQVECLVYALESTTWRELWRSLGIAVHYFEQVGLDPAAPDALVWETCQTQQLVLITSNRNADGPDSLEEVLRTRATPTSLPVFTIADANRFLRSPDYAARVTERLLEYLLDIEAYRGVGRLYLP